MEPMITDPFQSLFRSDRLLYESFDPSRDDIKTFVQDELLSDPAFAALSQGSLLRPRSKKDVDEYVQELSKGLIAVLICLPPLERVAGGGEAESNEVKKEAKDSTKPTPIGFVCLSGAPGDYQHHRSANIALGIAKAYQNKGYGREALNWVTDWGFRNANLHRIGIGAAAFNKRAVSLYEKVGFKFEGIFREKIWFDRKWHDLVNLSMLDRDWEALRGIVNGHE